MATKLVIDFDCNLVAGQSTAPTSWENCAKPVGVYAYGGVLLSNPNVDNITYPSAVMMGVSQGRHTNSTAYGTLYAFSATDFYQSSSQICVRRSKYSLGAEVYVTFDIRYYITPGQTIQGSTSDQSSDSSKKGDLFRWGDLRITLYQFNYTSPTYQAVYRVYNGATLIGTITVPDITSTTWNYCKIKCKLDATTGYIEANIDGYSHTAYTGQNTVATTTLASTGTELTADHIYFSPPVYRIGSYNNSGLIDNISVGESTFPIGRINASRWMMGTTSTDTNWAAVGTSPTTIPDSLLLPTDAKAARGTSVGASTLISIDGSFDFTGMQEDIAGVNVYLKRPAQLDGASTNRHIAVGVSISGVHAMDTVVAAEPLHIDNVVTPPNTNYTFGGLGGGVFTAGMTQTNFANTTIRLLVS